MRWLDVPHEVQRKPGWCLPACVAMVSAYWQHPLIQEDIARWLESRDIGTPASRITRLARRGFEVLYSTGSLGHLHELLERQIPPILFVHTVDLIPHWQINTPHAVVLAGLNGSAAVLFDPGLEEAPVTVQVGNLMLAWSHTDYSFASLRPHDLYRPQ